MRNTIIKDDSFIKELVEKNRDNRKKNPPKRDGKKAIEWNIRKDDFSRIMAHYCELYLKDSRYILEFMIEFFEYLAENGYTLWIREFMQLYYTKNSAFDRVIERNGVREVEHVDASTNVVLTPAVNIRDMAKQRQKELDRE